MDKMRKHSILPVDEGRKRDRTYGGNPERHAHAKGGRPVRNAEWDTDDGSHYRGEYSVGRADHG